ncbi:MAG: CIA30 family protein [Paracoccaceae bacterium]|nr:CIA30 family protein [Paracoccaceae bacterium]
MITRPILAGLTCLALLLPLTARAEMTVQNRLIPNESWTYVSDQVMGGVSEGAARLVTVDGQPVLHLTGQVSTANRGGFIQARVTLDSPPPATSQGIALRVRGNGEGYFVHLRTSGTVLPWQYYQAPFPTTPDWVELLIPFTSFKASGNLLRSAVPPEGIRSLGIVAYGRDHSADLQVMWTGFY